MMNKQRQSDYRFVVEVAVFMILLYGISLFVYLNGDDFMYGAFAHTGILSNVTSYYFTGNGRYWINILDSVLLWFGRFGFILILPWIVLAFIVLLAKNVQRIMAGHPDRNKEKELIRMGMVLFSCLDVLCLRETVFWITGMMNYLFPAVMFLWAYLMFQKSRAGELRGASKIGYYPLCILTASSVEQYALMFVGMMTLHHAHDLIRKVRIPAREWLAYGLSLLGLAALICAPGNFVRVDVQGAILPPFIDNAWTLLYQDTFSPVAFPYIVMLSLAAFPLLDCNQNKTSIKTWFIHVLLQVGIIISPFVDKAIYDVVLLVVLGCSIIYYMHRTKTLVAIPVYFLIFVGIGSQVMLLISAVWGFRCMLSLYMVYMLVIGCVMYHTEAKQRWFVLATGILVSFHPVGALVFWTVVILLWRKYDALPEKLSSSIACFGSAAALLVLLIGYGRNALIHELNLQNTSNPENQTIIIQELPDDAYSWYFVPISEFHEEYYRILHEVPENVEIIYESISE